jgi:formylglycine-generating enzyme required for sulfatase activity
MVSCPAELMEIDRFLAASSERREAVGREIAAALGEGWSPADRVGPKGLCAVRHAVLDLVFVVVPGGRFQMGFREDDRAAIARHVGTADPMAESIVKMCEKNARPVHEVEVRPHLFARTLLNTEQIDVIDPEYGSDEVDLPTARRFSAAAGFRLPAEAEYEWVAREGGALQFTCDAAASFTGASLSAAQLTNGFGVEGLFSPQWMEDDPHPDYQGAPSTSVAWTAAGQKGAKTRKRRRGEDGIRRGALEDRIERPADLLYCLASLRSGGDMITLRLCRDLV